MSFMIRLYASPRQRDAGTCRVVASSNNRMQPCVRHSLDAHTQTSHLPGARPMRNVRPYGNAR